MRTLEDNQGFDIEGLSIEEIVIDSVTRDDYVAALNKFDILLCEAIAVSQVTSERLAEARKGGRQRDYLRGYVHTEPHWCERCP